MLDFENKNNGNTSDANVISGKLDAVTSEKLKRRYFGSKIGIVATIVMLMVVSVMFSGCSPAENDVENAAETILAEEIDEGMPIEEIVEEDEETEEIEENEELEEELVSTEIAEVEGEATGEWVRITNNVGSSVWKYLTYLGTYMKEGRTPDGYMVTGSGNLYLFSPGAIICEVDNYEYNGYYPFSYDGSVLKNDILGISLSFIENDYQNGDILSISNLSYPLGEDICSIEIDDDTNIWLSLVSHMTDEDFAKSIEEFSGGVMVEEMTEATIAGKTLQGLRYIDNSNHEVSWYKFYYQLSNSMDLEICIDTYYRSTKLMRATKWLNEHLTLTTSQIADSTLPFPPEEGYKQETATHYILTPFNFDEEIQFIDDTYAYTKEHMDEYTNRGRYLNSWFSPYNGPNDTYYNFAGDLILMKNNVEDSPAGLSVDCYYLNPAMGRVLDEKAYEDAYIEELGLLIDCIDDIGNEYKIYLRDGFVIRYIDSGGNIHDYPDGVNLLQFTGYDGNIPLFSIFSACFPGWMVAYEGSGD